MHHNSDMVIHVLVDIAQKDTGYDGDTTECDTGQIHILVTLGVGDLASKHNHFVRGLVAGDTGNFLDAFEQTGARELDDLGDVGLVGDAQLQRHGAADVLDGVGDELVDKDVVVNRVTDAPADHADRESQGRHRRDDVVGTDDGRHDTRGDHDAADAQAAQDQETPEGVEVEPGAACQRAASRGHENGREDHEFAVVAPEHGQQPQDDAGAREDAETDGDTTDADTDGVVAVDVERLRRPEHDDAEEVGA
ncbi:uncharacterized protein PV06_00148 [Exophiala oligosperma]|uniref:Uncharacterized protein n=1 Tax=Exophiala oligosperma TaxID=215243 RepID=A0A0D2DWJ9_9EURO|nr:uncharacterized protein PV06_00148 [Exophiala oligosperma]KIW47453.1 hypothetical protein PV06_00148 [Exophiala oligosperma]